MRFFEPNLDPPTKEPEPTVWCPSCSEIMDYLFNDARFDCGACDNSLTPWDLQRMHYVEQHYYTES